MINHRYIWGASLLCALPVAVDPVSASPAGESAVTVCRNLVQEAREVERLLRTVSDCDSGRAAAAELRTRMGYMHNAMEQLGRLPVSSGEEIRALEQMLRDLTHITQLYMQVVQRLAEVNAYGAEELISIFQYYKMISQDSAAAPLPQESPLVHAYSEWCDAIDDVLFILRRIQNAESACALEPELVNQLRKVENRVEQVEKLQFGLSPQQLESERVPQDRLQRLRAELREELQRLRNAGAYGVSSLQEIMPACVRAARG